MKNKRFSFQAMIFRLAAICFFPAILSPAGFAQSYLPVAAGSKMKIKPVVDMKAYAFPLSDVQLLDSEFKKAMEAEVDYLLMLEPDRLLSQFRSHAGLEPKAEKYGGWESMGLAGHSLGHYLSACAMHYSVSNDEEFLNRVNYIVDELEACQRARNTGYIGAIPNEDSVFLKVSRGEIQSGGFDLNGAWAPWYTIHKIMAGLMDAYLYCGSEKALQINRRIADWAGNILKDLNYDQIQKMLRCEYGGMNEALANTYALTGNKKYLGFSRKFHDNFVLDSLAMEINILPGKHANTQIPKVIGAVRRYQLTGEESDYTIGKFFWNIMVGQHTYAPGGNSNYEYLSAPGELNDKLTYNTMETCNTHNMLKLTRHLFALDPSARLMDYYERALYNHILASQNRENGMVCYFVPLRMGARKHFSNPYHSFTCCVGTGMENHVKYGESIYFRGNDGGLYLNLFIPSKLNWKEKGVRVIMNSDLPENEIVELAIETDVPAAFPLKIRKPHWVGEDAELWVNEQKIENPTVDSDGYFLLNRTWNNGDQIKIRLPLSIYATPMPDNKTLMAFFYGHILLAGDLGPDEPDPVKGIPAFVTDNAHVGEWIRKDEGGPLRFHSVNVGTPHDVKFRPFYSFSDNYYSVYWDVFTTKGWETKQRIYEEEKRKKQALEARTVDVVRLGEMQPERDHQLTGELTEAGESHTKKYRIARDGGYFQFEITPDPDSGHLLLCTYWGMDNRGRKFDILVEGEVIATEDLNKYKESRFYEISYPVPRKLTKGKDKLVITFKPKPGNNAGPVYGVRLVKDNPSASASE